MVVSLLTWLGMLLEGIYDPRSRGPLLYREIRWTQGRCFEILKFRTTYPGTQDPGTVGEVTRTGYWLKKWYLDELPQLLNILRGDMTWVGPRPTHPERAHQEIEDEGMHSKLVLRAGLTGLVQVQKLEAQDRSVYRNLEEEYLSTIRQLNALQIVLHDWNILLRTVPTVMRGQGL
ncbi:MAG: sugar transferase [Candidatus Eremiobacteraeota bacterium]|nr:sugar transferase [Candidatus Eremiobacteraeota bacterium]MCW5868376.1 sugar transferase [Candidatus Eremiobacteraeota bacterium]